MAPQLNQQHGWQPRIQNKTVRNLSSQSLSRQAFTLVEMMVATTIFILGFTAVYSAFLAAAKIRAQADQLSEVSIASNSLINTWRSTVAYDINPNTGLLFAPSAYIGDGNPHTSLYLETDASSTLQNNIDGPLYPYPDNSTVWYRVISCTDLNDGNDPNSIGIRMTCIFGNLGQSPGIELEKSVMPFNDLALLYKVYKKDDSDPPQRVEPPEIESDPLIIKNSLVDRGILIEQEFYLSRQRF